MLLPLFHPWFIFHTATCSQATEVAAKYNNNKTTLTPYTPENPIGDGFTSFMRQAFVCATLKSSHPCKDEVQVYRH